MKKFIVGMLCLVLVISSLTGCGGKDEDTSGDKAKVTEAPTDKPADTSKDTPEDTSSDDTEEVEVVAPEDVTGTLTYWSFTDSANNLVTEFNKVYPNVEVDLTVFGGDEYKTKILTTLQSGKGVPDLFDLEEGYAYEFLDSDMLLNLSEIGIEDFVSDYYELQLASMKDSSGNYKSLGFQSSPVALWYLQDATEQWLGTSDATELATMLNGWDAMLAKSKEVYEKSNGEVFLWSNMSEMVKVQGFSLGPLVREGKLNVTDGWMGLIDDMRAMYDSGYIANLGSWSSEWANAWNEGKLLFRAFASWDFFTDWEKNAGNVGVAVPFESSYEGGTFISVFSDTENLDAAKTFLQYIASEDFQTVNMEEYNQVPANRAVAEKLSQGFTAENFGGQNTLQVYNDICVNTNGTTPDKYTRPVQNLFSKHTQDGIKTGLSNDEIVNNFKTELRDLYPEIEISE